jgi:hypothetical protein
MKSMDAQGRDNPVSTQTAAERSGLHIMTREDLTSAFYPLLQQGVGVRAGTGVSVRSFLCEGLGLSPDYLETRVQTVFLDGKAVDDLDSARVRDGSILALSAAMPGLLGATLRRGSYYAAMRSEISYHGREDTLPGGEGTVYVKLFNLLVGEVGSVLLRKGIWIPGMEIGEFLAKRPPRFWDACVKAVYDGREMAPEELRRMRFPREPLILRMSRVG